MSLNDPSHAPDAAPAALPGRWGAVLYETRTTHVRAEPRRVFRHRGYLWLVDLDRLPELPWPLRPLARFLPRDHTLDGSPGGGPGGIRRDLERHLAAHGLELGGGRVLMLTQARSLGHVFNPLTVYWCRDAAGAPLCTVAEVHNTYGGRHRYLLRADAAGRARSPKEFYVSPFLPLDGHYDLLLPEPDPHPRPAPDRAGAGTETGAGTARLHLAVRLELPGGRAFTATVTGTGRPAGPAALLRAVVRHPFATFAVSLRIRTQGIRLWLRGLPVHPRPTGPPAGRPTGRPGTRPVGRPDTRPRPRPRTGEAPPA
ncbi:DUF1365 domain-containing protein [Kitasatospora saccharophila]|uniref:DUF1365 domain-containing protein n=1 Tax=Kitasatospora saccharophila TaxID=407973 RepID=A0ABN2W9F3_9ACTN